MIRPCAQHRVSGIVHAAQVCYFRAGRCGFWAHFHSSVIEICPASPLPDVPCVFQSAVASLRCNRNTNPAEDSRALKVPPPRWLPASHRAAPAPIPCLAHRPRRTASKKMSPSPTCPFPAAVMDPTNRPKIGEGQPAVLLAPPPARQSFSRVGKRPP